MTTTINEGGETNGNRQRGKISGGWRGDANPDNEVEEVSADSFGNELVAHDRWG